MSTLYGIKNCDTVKKARTWLEQQGESFNFHDFRSDGLSEDLVNTWLDTIGAASLINRRSTTWKQLSQEQKDAFDQVPLPQSAIDVIIAKPTLIKRPVLERGNARTVGFKENQYRDFFN